LFSTDLQTLDEVPVIYEVGLAEGKHVVFEGYVLHLWGGWVEAECVDGVLDVFG